MPKATRWTACTAQRNNGSFCDAPTIPDAPFPICFEHGAQIFAFIRGAAEATNSTEAHMDVLADWSDRQNQLRVRPDGASTGVIYYVLIGAHVKIGCTVALKSRLAAYPPNRLLLATEPGYEREEAARHRQFADHLAMGREWFHPGDTLRAHIDNLRGRQGAAPVQTWAT